MNIKSDHIHCLGHDSVRIDGSITIYIDPWEVSGPPADLILITHDHFDHCDAPTVLKLSTAKTKIVSNASVITKLRDEGLDGQLTITEPGDELEYKGVNIKITPSYNIGKDFHPKSNNNLGFIVTMDGISIYHAGDTDLIEEMKAMKVDIALLPVSGTYTMSAEEAAEAAILISPKLAIPIHYGKIVGDLAMAEVFAKNLEGKIAVEIKAVKR